MWTNLFLVLVLEKNLFVIWHMIIWRCSTCRTGASSRWSTAEEPRTAQFSYPSSSCQMMRSQGNEMNDGICKTYWWQSQMYQFFKKQFGGFACSVICLLLFVGGTEIMHIVSKTNSLCLVDKWKWDSRFSRIQNFGMPLSIS